MSAAAAPIRESPPAGQYPQPERHPPRRRAPLPRRPAGAGQRPRTPLAAPEGDRRWSSLPHRGPASAAESASTSAGHTQRALRLSMPSTHRQQRMRAHGGHGDADLVFARACLADIFHLWPGLATAEDGDLGVGVGVGAVEDGWACRGVGGAVWRAGGVGGGTWTLALTFVMRCSSVRSHVVPLVRVWG